MSGDSRIYMEVGFNILYLIVVWTMVIVMSRRMSAVSNLDYPLANRFRWAFFLLALGDTGHVGFRVAAFAMGGLEANPMLVGLGALATAITVTFFYVVMLDIWKVRFSGKYGPFQIGLLVATVIRFIVMALPGNDWGSVVPPLPMGPIRNVFLIILGLGVLYLILRDAVKTKDRMFRWVAYCIFFSYLFYTPVVFFVQVNPLLGMLMIPKTIMYVAIQFIAYFGLWQRGNENVMVTEPAIAD